jgi:hypothetical protein
MDELKRQHDEHLASRPESISDEDFAALIEEHKENCPFCNEHLTVTKDPEERGDMEKEFTQAELDDAVATAVTPIQNELDSIKNSIAESEVDARVEAAELKIAELQKALEEAELRAGNAETELSNVVTFLATEKELSELAELAVAIREDRKAKIEEVANFTSEFIEANLDRWCKEDDEAFAARLEEWAANSVEKVSEQEVASLSTSVKNIRPVETETSIKTDLASFLTTKA